MDSLGIYQNGEIVDLPFRIFGHMLFPDNQESRETYIKYATLRGWSLVAKAHHKEMISFKPEYIIGATGVASKSFQDAYYRNAYLGSISGQILLFLSHLAHNKPNQASVTNAISLTESWGKKNQSKINMTTCWDAWRKFAPVRHFWAAYGWRGWEFSRILLDDASLSVKYDYLNFVVEAKKRKEWCERFLITDNSTATAKPLLKPGEGWLPPNEWTADLSENPQFVFPESEASYMPPMLEAIKIGRARKR